MENTYALPQQFVTRSEDDRHYIEGICVPYDTVTTRVGPVPEVFDRGAFRVALERGARVKLTDYNHSDKRVPVGYAETLEERPGGLWARFRLNRTPEGESARANALEGVYAGLSVGFIARQHEMRGGVRHVIDAHLDHVSLVEDPAYVEAEILAVRGAHSILDDYLRQLEQFRTFTPPAIDSAPRGGFTVAIRQLRSRSGGS